MHEVVDAGEEQPLAAAEPADQRMVERARLLLVAGDLGGGAGDDPLALDELPGELRAIDPRGTRNAGDHRGCVRRPASGRGQPGRQREARPRRRDVTDRLGNVPVLLAARQLEGTLRERFDEGDDRAGDGVELGDDPLRGARPGPAPDFATHAEELLRLDPPPGGHDVRRRGLEVGRPVSHLPSLSVSIRHLHRVGAAAEAPHRDDADRRAEGEQPEGDPPGVAVHRVEQADAEDGDGGQDEAARELE